MVISHATARAKNYYTYTATGVKLKVRHLNDPTLKEQPILGSTSTDGNMKGPTTDYVGNKIYEDGTLKTILTDNGYIEGNTYYFYIKDHLGNNRIIANASSGVIQSNHYYPFGMAFAEGTTTDQGKQDFKYNGKELDSNHELNQYDYSARFYDPGYSRFTTMDPLSEKYYSVSPYVYVGNNPMRFIDPTGMIWADPKDAEKLNKSINNRIESIAKNSTKIQSKIEKGGLSDKKLAKLENKLAENSQKVEMLNQSLADVEAIGHATETYKLTGPSASDEPHRVIKGENINNLFFNNKEKR